MKCSRSSPSLVASLVTSLGTSLFTSLGALSSLGCGPSTPTTPAPSGPAAWATVLDEGDLGGVVLSGFSAPSGELFVVGGPLGNQGFEAVAVRFDGTRWSDLAPGGADTLWWVSGSSASDVWMVGERGRITHFDGSTFEEHESGTTATLWGVMAFAPDDAWAVGGTPEGDPSEPDDVVLHWDGASWSPVALPALPQATGRALYKVWGPSADDFYVVGELGVIWHYEAGTFTLESDPPLAGGTLFTVHGCGPDDVYAVGGFSVLHRDGAGTWSEVDVDLTNSVNGVACAAPGEVLIVGGGGQKQRLEDGVWINDFAEDPLADLHAAVAVSGEGGPTLWAVGGDFFTSPKPEKRRGIVGRYGKGTVASSIE